jgi:hypothetical protein
MPLPPDSVTVRDGHLPQRLQHVAGSVTFHPVSMQSTLALASARSRSLMSRQA